MLDAAELAAWLRLLETPGIGRVHARRLLQAFGSPEAVFEASAQERCEHVGPALVAALEREPEGLQKQLQTCTQWLQQGTGERAVLTLGDARYPATLLQSADPPLLLYCQGRIDLLQQPSVAVVGSRNPTPQGEDNARDFSQALSAAQLCIVSGLALGIDGAAHEGGLSGLGSTIAVIATGLDRVYPKRHLTLAHQIAEKGLMVSEFALGTPPVPSNFPVRNRIIAGLSLGTLVVEANLKSGSLITARLAAEMGRDVFAIPGSIHSPQSRGCHALLKQGAKLVDCAQDVLEELRLPSAPLKAATIAATSGLDPALADELPTDPLLQALGHDTTTLDMLVERTGEPAHTLSARLLEWELEGSVVRLPGGLFQRRTTA